MEDVFKCYGKETVVAQKTVLGNKDGQEQDFQRKKNPACAEFSDCRLRIIKPKTDMNSEDVYAELERAVGSVGLENAYPWNNTLDLDEFCVNVAPRVNFL